MKAAEYVRRLPLVGRAIEHLEEMRITLERHDARGRGMAAVDALASRGDAIVAAALAEWRKHVEEPPAGDAAQIDAYIRGEFGLGWGSGNRRRLNERVEYVSNRDFEWCGAFAAHCYGRVGLKLTARRRDFASCYRLQRWAGEDKRRRVALADIAPGNILIVGDGRVPRGTHITIVERVAGDIIHTIEGNARGLLPDGSIGEGVIRRTRPIRKMGRFARCEVSGLSMRLRALHAYRPADDDFDGSEA
jgi:hypothetical protein